MADFVFNVAKGKAAYYATLPGTNDALVAAVLDAAGLEADATLKDYDTLAALLAGTSNEHTTLTRQTLAGVSATVDDSTDTASVTSSNLSWTTPAAGSGATGKLLICYDPDTTAGTDADIIPLSAHDVNITPNGTNVTGNVDAAGFYGAS